MWHAYGQTWGNCWFRRVTNIFLLYLLLPSPCDPKWLTDRWLHGDTSTLVCFCMLWGCHATPSPFPLPPRYKLQPVWSWIEKRKNWREWHRPKKDNGHGSDWWEQTPFCCSSQGRSQDFSKGGITRCQNEVTHQIFMSFLPPVVGCLLKTWLTKGGSRTPQDPPPGYAPGSSWCRL